MEIILVLICYFTQMLPLCQCYAGGGFKKRKNTCKKLQCDRLTMFIHVYILRHFCRAIYAVVAIPLICISGGIRLFAMLQINASV